MPDMLRFSKSRAPCLTTWFLFFNTLLGERLGMRWQRQPGAAMG